MYVDSLAYVRVKGGKDEFSIDNWMRHAMCTWRSEWMGMEFQRVQYDEEKMEWSFRAYNMMKKEMLSKCESR